jgi:hypothetical protein
MVEDEIHMFRCRHAVQQEEIQQLQDRISKELKIKDDVKDVLSQIFSAGVQEGSWNPASNSICTNELRKGIEAQSQIGWHHVIYGRLAKDFVTCLATTDEPSFPKTSAEMHGRKLIRAIWDAMLTLWKQRNEAVHGITEEVRRVARIQALDLKVRYCYEQQYIMPIDDWRRLFQKTKDEKLREDPRNIQAWIWMAEKIIRTNKRENKRIMGQKKMMEQYFKWNPPDQKASRRNREHHQHRKHDLKPD